MVSDSVSNLIISLKNASKAGKASITAPYSKLSESILEVLKKEGYISDLEKKGKKIDKQIDVVLKYVDGKPAILDVKRISKFSRRIYKGVKDIRPVRTGYGMLVLTTPKGILSDREAKKASVGGEALFEIW